MEGGRGREREGGRGGGRERGGEGKEGRERREGGAGVSPPCQACRSPGSLFDAPLQASLQLGKLRLRVRVSHSLLRGGGIPSNSCATLTSSRFSPGTAGAGGRGTCPGGVDSEFSEWPEL